MEMTKFGGDLEEMDCQDQNSQLLCCSLYLDAPSILTLCIELRYPELIRNQFPLFHTQLTSDPTPAPVEVEVF